MRPLQKRFFFCCFVFIPIFTACVFCGCAKEYSYEGGSYQNIPRALNPSNDSIIQRGPLIPGCLNCEAHIPAGLFWSFKINGSLLCGNITNSVITPDRDGFTFFGPSECSQDSGLIMTILLDTTTVLKKNRNNIVTNRATIEYYDNTTLTDVFISKRPAVTFTIDSYDHGTGVANGSFFGTVTTRDSSKNIITEGRYEIQFK